MRRLAREAVDDAVHRVHGLGAAVGARWASCWSPRRGTRRRSSARGAGRAGARPCCTGARCPTSCRRRGSTQMRSRTASIVPSRRAPISMSCTCGACAAAIMCSRRSSVHFTGRRVAIAAAGIREIFRSRWPSCRIRRPCPARSRGSCARQPSAATRPCCTKWTTCVEFHVVRLPSRGSRCADHAARSIGADVPLHVERSRTRTSASARRPRSVAEPVRSGRRRCRTRRCGSAARSPGRPRDRVRHRRERLVVHLHQLRRSRARGSPRGPSPRSRRRSGRPRGRARALRHLPHRHVDARGEPRRDRAEQRQRLHEPLGSRERELRRRRCRVPRRRGRR